MESKKEVYDLIPFEYYPATLLFKSSSSTQEILALIKQRNLKYPLIGKPDIGMKGMMVKKLENEKELLSYATNSKVDFLIQEFVSFKNEIGIFYYRYPNEANGHISGIVKKELLTVTGDGISTVEKLLLKNKRAVLQLPP
jgi:carbamoylphosphate synthase large subunit